jgi:hypothetical protein
MDVNVIFVFENRASNLHAHSIAPSSPDLCQGRRLLLLDSRDINLVPLIIDQ